MALIEIGADYPLQRIDLDAGQQRDLAYLALNPNGVVPTPVMAVKAAAMAMPEAPWNRIDAHLHAHGPYLLGAQFSSADIFLTMLMRWSRHTPRQPIEWPALRNLADLVRSRPSWKHLYKLEGLTEWVGRVTDVPHLIA